MNIKSKPNIALSLLIIILNISTSVIFWANLKPFYLTKFKEHSVYQVFNYFDISKDKALTNFDDLLKYINFRKTSLDSSFYSETDIAHMKDVRNLFMLLYIIFFIALILFLYISKKKDNNINKELLFGSISSLLIIIGVAFTNYLISFSSFFTIFHKLFFRNDYWLLDPNTSNLIRYFPDGIFEQQGVLIALTVVLFSVIELVLSLIPKKQDGKEK